MIFTKQDYARYILSNANVEDTINFTDFNPSMIYLSSSVAVAADILNLLDDEKDKEYSQTRGGHFALFHHKGPNNKGKIKQMSLREFFDLLPDEESCKNSENNDTDDGVSWNRLEMRDEFKGE